MSEGFAAKTADQFSSDQIRSVLITGKIVELLLKLWDEAVRRLKNIYKKLEKVIKPFINLLESIEKLLEHIVWCNQESTKIRPIRDLRKEGQLSEKCPRVQNVLWQRSGKSYVWERPLTAWESPFIHLESRLLRASERWLCGVMRLKPIHLV